MARVLHSSSKTAAADYPAEWPNLVDSLSQLILHTTRSNCMVWLPSSTGGRSGVHWHAVFRGCFSVFEMSSEDHNASAKGFADEILNKWLPFFIVLLKTKLSDLPSE